MHSKTTVNPFFPSALRALEEVIPYFYAEADSKIRNDFLAAIKRLCLRLQSTIVNLQKLQYNGTTSGTEAIDPSTKTDAEARSKSGLSDHRNFVQWLFVFSCGELQPSASYQRRISSLQVLTLMLRHDLFSASNVWSGPLTLRCAKHQQIEPFTGTTFCMLIDRVMDAFDDIRGCATSILKQFPKSFFSDALDVQSTSHPHDPVCLARAEEMLRSTGRADMGDGYGRLIEVMFDRTLPDEGAALTQKADLLLLLDQLENEIRIAKIDMARAVAHAPIHGRLIALR